MRGAARDLQALLGTTAARGPGADALLTSASRPKDTRDPRLDRPSGCLRLQDSRSRLLSHSRPRRRHRHRTSCCRLGWPPDGASLGRASTQMVRLQRSSTHYDRLLGRSSRLLQPARHRHRGAPGQACQFGGLDRSAFPEVLAPHAWPAAIAASGVIPYASRERIAPMWHPARSAISTIVRR